MRREYMIRYRMRHKLSESEMARRCKISTGLLTDLEENDKYVTHPRIVERVAAAYKLTRKQAEGTLPLNYRPGPDYDPDRYVIDANAEWRNENECSGTDDSDTGDNGAECGKSEEPALSEHA